MFGFKYVVEDESSFKPGDVQKTHFIVILEHNLLKNEVNIDLGFKSSILKEAAG